MQVLLRPLDVRLASVCLAILFLNMLDAFATLHHLEHGAEELNPLMQLLLHRGAGHFMVVKHALASLGVIGIALHPERRAATVALWILFPVYLALGIYQVGLFYLM